METSVIIHVVFNELFLFKLPSDFGFFQEKTLIFKESVKTSTATVWFDTLFPVIRCLAEDLIRLSFKRTQLNIPFTKLRNLANWQLAEFNTH